MTLHEGDCLTVMRAMAARGERVHAVVTDPPYELGFMGKGWDKAGVAFDAATWRAAFDLLPPGGHLVAFGGTRTFHRMAVAIEDAGFEIRDTLMWLYGTGFPKSHDVSKGIDKMLGAERERVPPRSVIGHQRNVGNVRPYMLDPHHMTVSDEPASVEAAAWTGWGTALKPAWEPIILARKPLAGTVAQNVLAHGTGAINVDACRVAADGPRRMCGATNNPGGVTSYQTGSRVETHTDAGRWPANVVHDGSDEVEAAFAAFGDRPGQLGRSSTNPETNKTRSIYGAMNHTAEAMHPRGDSGSASRFFYSAKASKEDRAGSKHPTVKPVALMRWLVRMVTPPGGVVLDPFAGSGTTGAACAAEGMQCVLIEREAEYVADIRRRLGLPAESPMELL